MIKNLNIRQLNINIALKFLLVFLFFISISHLSYAQQFSTNKKATKYFSKAKQYYFSGDNKNSLIYCDKATKTDSGFTEPLVLKAQILYEEAKYNDAVKLLKRVLQISPNYTQIYFIIAKYFIKIQDYKQAIEHLKQYLKLETNETDKQNASELLKICQFRYKEMENPVQFSPVRLDSNINTKLNEYFPTISADDQAILFTRLVGTGRNKQEDIYISRKNNLGKYSPAISVSPLINTRANEGAHCLSVDGMIMIFTRCTAGGSCDLYVTSKDESGFWTMPVKLPAPVNTRYWESQPSLSPDNKTLYFASNRPGGYGKMDIWKSKFLGNGKWSKPVNLGDSINTKGNEMSPFIHFDNKTLYFASDGHTGMGKYDLFVSKKINDTTWTKPKNLGYPINTDKNEFRLVVTADGKTAYYSTEKDTIYHQDIYKFKLNKNVQPQRTLYVKALIYREPDYLETKADKISVINLNTGDTVFYTEKKSYFLACLPSQNDYALNILKKGYLLYSQNFSLINIPDSINFYNIEVYLKPIAENMKFTLNNLFYNTDSYTINPKSYVELNKLVEFLKMNPDVKIKIEGHTDNVGTYKHNMLLSENRAKAVAIYLEQKGINKNRIEYKGYGYSKPIAENNTEQGRSKNRRTEILILKK